MNVVPSMVWLPADHRLLGNAERQLPFIILGDKYARAVKLGAGSQPVVFPLCEISQIDGLLSLVDGVVLTGSPSNVHPSHFGEEVADTSLPLDPQRDELTLALVRACTAQQVPLLGICRGFQEINVAMGGSLHQRVHHVPGLQDHREKADKSYDVQYAPSHAVELEPGSVLHQWAGATSAQVNSLHGQGIARLAQGVRALAHGPDGLVEAFEITEARSFACAMQWHPEWKFWETPFYAATFAAFGDACRARKRDRTTA